MKPFWILMVYSYASVGLVHSIFTMLRHLHWIPPACM